MDRMPILLPRAIFRNLSQTITPSGGERRFSLTVSMRSGAGASDARQPFDDIRRRFDQLGKPPFRLSCRAADWLGANDEAKLTSVTQNGKVPTVLLLDPLTDSDIREILNCDPNVDDPEEFIEVARERGVGDLLTNPQTLVLIAKAVAKDGNWPQSRTETFEMACLHMATENNDEHRIAGGLPAPERVLKAAGRLSAALLLSGSGGYTLENSEPEDSHPGLESFGEDSRELLRAALSTKLFKSVGMGQFEPVHRHIAEFLGGRYLAQVTDDGLPARRATAPDDWLRRERGNGIAGAFSLVRGPLSGCQE